MGWMSAFYFGSGGGGGGIVLVDSLTVFIEQNSLTVGVTDGTVNVRVANVEPVVYHDGRPLFTFFQR